jgi:hypothetical protein
MIPPHICLNPTFLPTLITSHTPIRLTPLAQLYLTCHIQKTISSDTFTTSPLPSLEDGSKCSGTSLGLSYSHQPTPSLFSHCLSLPHLPTQCILLLAPCLPFPEPRLRLILLGRHVLYCWTCILILPHQRAPSLLSLVMDLYPAYSPSPMSLPRPLLT